MHGRYGIYYTDDLGTGESDLLDGGKGNDTLLGSTDLINFKGDYLNGGEGDDILNGYGNAIRHGNTFETDTLNGGSGADTFILGDTINGVFYIDGTNNDIYTNRAIIEDFNYLEKDTIVLLGSYSNYLFKDIGNDAEIWNSSGTDLIAIVKNGAGSNLIPQLDCTFV